MRTLLTGGHIYSPAEPFATAILLDGDRIAWIGTDAGADVHADDVDHVLALNGALVSPGFVHLADEEPAIAHGYVRGVADAVRVADRWPEPEWDAALAAHAPLAVVAKSPCRLRSAIAAGLPVALCPAEEQSPWEAIRAAVFEVDEPERVSARAAFAALTRSAWRLVGDPERGVLSVGSVAEMAVWRAGDLVVESPDPRISNWSTDPRAAVPALPALTGDLPVCEQVWIGGILRFAR